jgi:acyl transferase domain-containing protein/acyl carrier protein
LAAVHLAAQGLLLGDCNVAVAGAVTIIQPNKCGYMYNEGGIHSPTGQCRVFDAEANGTIFGDGGGAIVMRRLSDAVRDRDHIYAVIQSTACNNDGRRKVGFVAPSADGQTEVIRTAFEMGEVDPESVSLLEAHGTGTRVGDPIELKALKNAFHTEKNSFCAIGSVKANVGHLHAGAGMAGLVKVVLAMNHEVIPPVINFVAPNPELGIEQSPFYINKQALPWEAGEKPRRAGISSFGVGGTNVHVILRDYPRQTAPDVNGKTILYLSAKNENALQEAKDNMIAFLRSSRENIHDIAYTLIMGRKHYACKAICIVEDAWDAAEALYDRKRLFCCGQMKKTRPVAFVFPGLGCQYYGMGGAIYRNEPEFRALVDRISARMKLVLGFDLSQIIAEKNDNLAQRIDETLVAWSVLLTVSYALARTLMHYGVQPALMIDRCAGELTVAVLEDSMDALCELMTGASEQEDLKLFEEQRARAMRDDYLFLELGPTAPSQSEMAERVISVVPREKENAAEAWLACLACLEAERIPINWNNFYRHRARRRIPLPLYPFQRQRYQNSRIIENLGVHAKAGERAEPPRDESKGAIFTRSGFDASYTPPETDVQRIICETAAEVLSIDSVGIHDDFYSLGGHSLLFTRIISQLKQIFQTEIPLDEVFDQPTVASIERIIRRQWNDSQILDEIAAAYREYQENDRGVV